ncbi:hypothetical protein ACWN6Y_07575 [Vagococcus teuberi]|uniref:Uncharacterized protein n=1 Tax=Vagococcus teuberi TaxID=519472 RepID=A0A1J0A3V2_9ENTE|nr:hypothetical protein [Vagococcus teuberi]APB30613.1 hypothetical protein BHY08_01490 [Vagococcus teuberi]
MYSKLDIYKELDPLFDDRAKEKSKKSSSVENDIKKVEQTYKINMSDFKIGNSVQMNQKVFDYFKILTALINKSPYVKTKKKEVNYGIANLSKYMSYYQELVDNIEVIEDDDTRELITNHTIFIETKKEIENLKRFSETITKYFIASSFLDIKGRNKFLTELNDYFDRLIDDMLYHQTDSTNNDILFTKKEELVNNGLHRKAQEGDEGALKEWYETLGPYQVLVNEQLELNQLPQLDMLLANHIYFESEKLKLNQIQDEINILTKLSDEPQNCSSTELKRYESQLNGLISKEEEIKRNCANYLQPVSYSQEILDIRDNYEKVKNNFLYFKDLPFIGDNDLSNFEGLLYGDDTDLSDFANLLYVDNNEFIYSENKEKLNEVFNNLSTDHYLSDDQFLIIPINNLREKKVTEINENKEGMIRKPYKDGHNQ